MYSQKYESTHICLFGIVLTFEKIYSVHVCFSQFQHLDSDGLRLDTDSLLSEPIFVPVKFDAVAAAVQDNSHGFANATLLTCGFAEKSASITICSAISGSTTANFSINY